MLNTPGFFYSTDRSKAVVQVLDLLFVALWFIVRGSRTRRFESCLALCHFVFVFFVLLALRFSRLRKRESKS